MRNELIKGYKLIFPEKKEEYIIKDVLGRGASCLVYLAEINEGNNVRYSIIKEFNPVKLDLKRDASGTLIIPDEKSEEYSIQLERFKLGYEKQQQIRIINDLTNTTSNIQGIYHTNNTEYIEMTYFNGETYSFNSEKSLYNFFRRMKALTQVISNYHNAGFLHLDIKPDNVYVLPETPEMVMLFDFDSVIEKDVVVGNSPLSYTKDWASIEQIDLKRRKEICEATDLFAVGEMIFYYFFGRHSDISERRSFSKYSFDYNTDQFDGANPLIIKHLSELLHNTICNIVKNRYQTAQELIDKLDILISLSNPNEPFLKTNIPSATDFFVGRDDELDLLHDKIQDTNVLFVSGIGGIGKSELVKQYAKKHVNDYDAIIFVPFVSDVFTIITDDAALPICNFKQFPEEKVEEYYARKLRKLKELCDDNVLIIIDNFDNAEELDKILELNCKMLFTTRCDFSDVYAQIDLDALKEKQHIIDIFNNFYTKSLSVEDKEIVEEIIDIVEGHTMTVELLAKQMMAGRVSPMQMLERLTDGGIADSGKEKIRIAKDDSLKTGNAYSHIQALFDLSELNNDEIYVLANLCLIPHTGISAELFCKWCEIDNYDIINSLVNEGWIRVNKEDDYISLHPIITEVLLKNIFSEAECLNFLNSVYESVQGIYDVNIDKQKEFVRLYRHILDFVYRNNLCSEETVKFMREASFKLRTLGENEKLKSYLIRTIDVCLSIFGKENINTALGYRYLSILYRSELKIFESRKACLECLKIMKLLYGTKSKEYMETLLELGHNYKFERLYEKAEKIYSRILDFYIDIYGNKNKETLKCMLAIGDLYSLMGEHEKAIDILNERVDISGDVNDEINISSYMCLSTCCRNIGQYELSVRYGKKAISALEQRRSIDNSHIATAYSAVGMAYLELGELTLAKEFLCKSLNIRKKVYGDEHFRTSRSYYRLGCLYEKTGELDLALKYFEKASDIQKQTLGIEDPETIESFNKLEKLNERYN